MTYAVAAETVTRLPWAYGELLAALGEVQRLTAELAALGARRKAGLLSGRDRYRRAYLNRGLREARLARSGGKRSR